jgi:hypothetical protein
LSVLAVPGGAPFAGLIAPRAVLYRSGMRLLFSIFLTMSLDAAAACACPCVNGFGAAVCDSAQDPVPSCIQRQCKPPPPSYRPQSPDPNPPVGANSCSWYQEESLGSSTGYAWAGLCRSASSSAFLKPARRYPLPVPNQQSSRGAPCSTDRDCASGQVCGRRSANEPWTCRRR